MKIIIVGAGRIGSNLCKALSKENHEVYLIELDEEIAHRADEKLDVKVICGSGADPLVLKEASLEQADLMIAVTTYDETNLVVCSLAAIYGTKRRIARVRNTHLIRTIDENRGQYFFANEIINPEGLAAEAIVKAVRAPGSREVGDFAEGRILLRSFDIPAVSPLIGSKIVDFRDDEFPWPFLIVAISRQKEVIIPKGDTKIETGDRIYVLLPCASLGEFLSLINPDTKKPNKVVLYGATETGEQLARDLGGLIKDLILLEEDYNKAGSLADRLEGIRVINGSGTEKDILIEAGIEATDLFIAVSDNDHSNLVSAVLARKLGAKDTIITTQQPDYTSIIDALAIDVIINPHLLAVQRILSLVRGKSVTAVTKIVECEAEAVEFMVEEDSAITKAPIKDISFPKNSIIGAVDRGKQVYLAQGDTQIQAGDKVIVFCQENAVKKLQALFTNSK